MKTLKPKYRYVNSCARLKCRGWKVIPGEYLDCLAMRLSWIFISPRGTVCSRVD